MLSFGVMWLLLAVSFIFITMLDFVSYGILGISYNLFILISKLDLFGGSSAGKVLYDGFSSRFYMVISIIMVFVFSYQLLLVIINPDDNKNGKGMSSFVKDTVISVVLVIVCPLIFRYMSVFQNHMIQDNTIGAIVLGESSSNSKINPGKSISMIVYMSFYHPKGMTYSDFFDNDGNLLDGVCSGRSGSADEASEDTCQAFYDDLKKWYESGSTPAALTSDTKLQKQIDEDGGMEYWWIISNVCALIVAWFFISYTIDIATRAVKLGFLELVAPIPIFLRVFSKTKPSFDKWVQQVIKTYLELFVRLAVIFFIVELCKMVPSFISIIFNGADSTSDNVILKLFATVFLIIGLLQFAKEAPGLFNDLFSLGGGSLSGMKFGPAGAGHAIGAATGALGGGFQSALSGTGFRNGAKMGAANGFKEKGMQFGNQRQGVYTYFGGKGKHGILGGQASTEKIPADAEKAGKKATKDAYKQKFRTSAEYKDFYSAAMSESLDTLNADHNNKKASLDSRRANNKHELDAAQANVAGLTTAYKDATTDFTKQYQDMEARYGLTGLTGDARKNAEANAHTRISNSIKDGTASVEDRAYLDSLEKYNKAKAAFTSNNKKVTDLRDERLRIAHDYANLAKDHVYTQAEVESDKDALKSVYYKADQSMINASKNIDGSSFSDEAKQYRSVAQADAIDDYKETSEYKKNVAVYSQALNNSGVPASPTASPLPITSPPPGSTGGAGGPGGAGGSHGAGGAGGSGDAGGGHPHP